MPISWGLALFGANQNAWNALPSDLRSLLRNELPKLEAAIWQESESETQEGFACARGADSCKSQRKGKMTEVAISAQDESTTKELFTKTVLARWLQRCGSQCADLWNKTIGPAQGITGLTAK
jgi:TRAP-type C4-dicarboxylate transport system substrate-binding protein